MLQQVSVYKGQINVTKITLDTNFVAYVLGASCGSKFCFLTQGSAMGKCRAGGGGGGLRRSVTALRTPHALGPADSAAFIDSKIHIPSHILASLKLDCVLQLLAS